MSEVIKESKSYVKREKEDFLKKVRRLTKPNIEQLEIIEKYEKRVNNPDNSRKILVTK